MKKINHLKELDAYYKQRKNIVSLVEVPEMQFLMIDGTKGPNENPDYTDSVGALYKIAYTLKFIVKKGEMAVDYKVMPLEGLWWADNMANINLNNRDNWKWTAMILQPDFISQEMFAKAHRQAKKKSDNPKLEFVRLESFTEGLSMQIFHQGPYGEMERNSIEKLHKKIEEEGFQLTGKHHEIYLNSPGRTAPENLKTIIRQPMKK